MTFNLKDDGFTIVENLLTEEQLSQREALNYKGEFREDKAKFYGMSKYSDIDFPLEINNLIKNKAKEFTGQTYDIFMKKMYYKAAYFGSCEYYHQDYFYRQKLGVPNSKYLQCFIAVEDLDHAPLNVFVGSHKGSLHNHQMVLERDGNAKYSILNMKDICSGYNFKSLKLKKGDAVFFDYMLVHGSGSNATPFPQSRIVVQLCSEQLPKNNSQGGDIFKERRKFELMTLTNSFERKLSDLDVNIDEFYYWKTFNNNTKKNQKSP